MYQLYAYGTKYKECSKLYLIYPYDNNHINLRYLYQQEDEKLVLNVLFFDLVSDTTSFYVQNNSKIEYKLFSLINKI